MLVAGVDEAGRGPCFGPMVLSIVVIEKDVEEELKTEGVKDSKEILPAKREKLEKIILKKATEQIVIELSPIEINDLMTHNSLNEIEAMQIAKMINKLKTKPEIIYIDSPDTIPKKFEGRIEKYLTKTNVKMRAEHKADSKYIPAGAASVLAKVARDRAIEKLCNQYGDFGSGYPSDPKTKKYLADYVSKNKKLPPFSRIFWKTCENALTKIGQQKIL
jgi:ribonuclease HII